MNKPRRETFESSWEWLNWAAQLPSMTVPFNGLASGASPITGRMILAGGVFKNTATTAGAVELWDNSAASGVLAAAVTVAASSYATLQVPDHGVLIEIGLFMNPVTATLTGSLYVIPLWHAERTAPGR